MKNKLNELLYKGSCVLLAMTYVGSFVIKDKVTTEKVEIVPKKAASSTLTPITKESSPKTETRIFDENKNPHLKIGAYVTVHGRGNEASDGSGKLGYSWNGKEMMLVGIRENSEYPYACAIVDSTPGVEDVMAWFKADDIMPLTKDFTIYKDSIKIIGEDGTVTYIAPEGYILCNGESNSCVKVTRKYVCSEESKEEISKKYSIPLK